MGRIGRYRRRLCRCGFGLVLALGACRPSPAPVEPSDCGSDEVLVEITTSDGVTLHADYRPAAAPDRAAVVLFHMAPPQNDRSGYPARVRAALAEQGVSVLNVDRRGAGGSGGQASEAAQGPGARLDMEAAVAFLLDDQLPCSVDASRLVLVGASNGTTAVFDYLVGHQASLPDPVAAIWMSPGSYTENNNSVTEHRDRLEALPLLWLHPITEDWSLNYMSGAPDLWRFVVNGNQHGTRMFDQGATEDLAVGEMRSWLAAWTADPPGR